MKKQSLEIPGSLVSLPIPGSDRVLDGFWAHGPRRKRGLLILVHGMGGNFFRSRFRKELLLRSRNSRFDALSFNNRGADRDVATEKFMDCVSDLDTAIRFGLARGYRKFVLMGHSTGCQKVTLYQAVRRRKDVAALVLGSIGDDLAISRHNLGRDYARWVKRATALVARGRGQTILPAGCQGFSAARFLSIADPRQLEARLFDFEGPLTQFRKITCPTLVILGSCEEFACIPVAQMIEILEKKSRARRFASIIVPGGDHGFHGQEVPTARTVYRWLGTL
ncbi:MAG: alpha/beta fold hydrolase [bacterium]